MESNWFDYIKENPDKKWNYYSLSLNPNITWEIVQENPDKDWSYDSLSENPNITWEIVKANPDKNWNYGSLCSNKMSKHSFFENKQLTYILK